MKITAITKYKHGTLYNLLQKLNWSQSELARRAGITPGIIGHIINLRKRPSINQANQIQSAFAEEGVFLDVLDEWPETFNGLSAGYKRVDTADVPMQNIISCKEAYLLPSPDSEDTSDMSAALSNALDKLTEREKKAVQCYFYQGKTFQEIGKELVMRRRNGNALSVQRTGQILHKAIRKLRSPRIIKELETTRY